MSEDIEEMFLHTKPVRALIVASNPMTESYISSIKTEIETSFAHTVKIIERLEQAGLVEKESQGRKKIVKPTEKGKRIARPAQQLKAELRDQSVQTGFRETVFQGEAWNIVEGDDGLYIDCLETSTALVDIDELEKAVKQLKESTVSLP